ncbi:MFS transporter [Virgibacillus flavescens]|uniref:MFS transporter n=1 Tax=Virgibacillus flavescens TaxID=1611422 RepID=UPI003D34D1BD
MGKQSQQTNEVHDKRWAIVSMASIPLIMTLGNSMLIPVLPMMEQELDISKLQSSYIISVYSIVGIFLIPIAGFLSDRYGRKNIIIPSLIITAIGALIAGWASWKMQDAFLFIIIGRILQGIGASGAAPIVMPLVGDMFRSDKDISSTLGIIETSNTFGKVLSPVLGAVLAGMIWFLPFFSIPVFCLLSILLIFFLVKKPKEEQEGPSFTEFKENTKEVFKKHKRWLMAIFIIGAILMFILFGVLFYLSSMLEEVYNFKGITKGLYLAVPLAALCLASFITGKKIEDNLVMMKWITFGGIVLAGSSIVAIRFSEQFVYLIVVFLFCGIGIGAVLPCLDSLITESIQKEIRGTITSIYSSARFVGVAGGPPAVALLMKQDLTWLVSLLGFLALIAAYLAFKNIKPEAKR